MDLWQYLLDTYAPNLMLQILHPDITLEPIVPELSAQHRAHNVATHMAMSRRMKCAAVRLRPAVIMDSCIVARLLHPIAGNSPFSFRRPGQSLTIVHVMN